MPLLALVRLAISDMIESAGTCMKALLMDNETLVIVSVSHTKNELIAKEVFHMEIMCDRPHSPNSSDSAVLSILTCICFLRPSPEVIAITARELATPRFKSYFLYFSRSISSADIKRLAEADSFKRVQSLKIVEIDFVPLIGNVFLMGTDQSSASYLHKWKSNLMDQCVHSIMSLLMSMKYFPVVRFQRASDMCKSLAAGLHTALTKKAEKFILNDDISPLVLIVDRREDAVTPMLNQWTYQAMLHELLGLQRNRIKQDTSYQGESNADIQPSVEGMVLNDVSDTFFAENKYCNYGSIAHEISMMLEQHHVKHKNFKKIETIDDMKKFIHDFPEFKEMSKTIREKSSTK